jgi:hypothetical protein
MKSDGMTCNVGGKDRAVRAIAATGLVLGAQCTHVPASVRGVLYALGAVAAFTVLTRYCPMNTLLGVNTCRT